MPKYQVAKSHHKRKQKMKKRSKSRSRKSSHHLTRKKIRPSARKERKLADGYDDSLTSDQNSLQNVRIQGQPLEKEDGHSSHKSDSSRLSEQGHGRRQKTYETDEFIDYLLNCHQYPYYFRICLQPSDTASPDQWKKAVHAKGNGFQVTLRKRKHRSSDSSPAQGVAAREQSEEGDGWSEISPKDPQEKPQKRGRADYAKERSKESNHCKDTDSEASDRLSPADRKSCLSEKTRAYQARDSKSTSKSQASSPSKSESLEIQLTDFLEDISSDSECFSEILSVNKEDKEKSVPTYNGSPEKRSPHADETITSNQDIRLSPQTWCSEWNHNGVESYSDYQLWKPVKRSEYELAWLEGENSFMRGENNSKQRETLVPKYMFHEGYYRGPSPSRLLDDMTRKRRRFEDRIFGHNMNYRPPHVPITSANSANVFYLGGFPQRREAPWRPEYNPEMRRFKRHERFKDFMLNAGNYYIRQDSWEHMDYGGFLRADYTNPLYFQMF